MDRRYLAAVSRLGTNLTVVDRVIEEALDVLGQVIPYDLATVMELDGDELAVRVARGRLDGGGARVR